MKHKIIFLFLLLSPVLIIVGICALAATSGPLNNSKLPELKQKDYPFSLSAKQLRKMLAPDAVKYDSDRDILALYRNSEFSFKIEIPRTQSVDFFFIARGAPANNAYPALRIKVDNESVSEFFTPSEEWGLYRAPMHLTKGTHFINIGFFNDRYRPADARCVPLALAK